MRVRIIKERSLTPGHEYDDSNQRVMLPFLIPMEKLLESYVAMWLHRHLEFAWKVKPQERFNFENSSQFFQIDMVVYHATGKRNA